MMLGILGKWALYVKKTCAIFEEDIHSLSAILDDNKKAKDIHRHIVNEAKKLAKINIRSFDSIYRELLNIEMIKERNNSA